MTSFPQRIRKAATALTVAALIAGLSARADELSTGVNGIHSAGLGLTGAGVRIGQVEVNRPGLPGTEAAANTNALVTPTAAFIQTTQVSAANGNLNQRIDNHATEVAGVMIATGMGAPRSVAPGAALYSGADVVPGANNTTTILTTQNIAAQGVKAINMSFGNSLTGGNTNNGNDPLSQYVDYSSRVNDVLHVTAGDENGAIIPSTPQDAFNTINVGYTRATGGEFNRVDNGNVFTTTADGRREIDILAPGTNITMPATNNKLVPPPVQDGTSFAAPHVTGTVALLQQFANQKIAAGAPNFDSDATRHEVMKAVIMNSADKIKDDGTVVPLGRALGMEKTIYDTTGTKTWMDGDAYTSQVKPLDLQMGVGQLNASRAVTQLGAGEHDSFGSALVPEIGWDYGVTLGAGDLNKYVFDRKLYGDSFLSITLAWDRIVNLNDTNTNGTFDNGETFTTVGLTDLDLYLLPKGATDVTQAIWASNSSIYSVEHIFYKIEKTGDYEFWVRQAFASPNAQPQFYGVAWWATAVPEPSTFALAFVALVGTGLAGARRRRAFS